MENLGDAIRIARNIRKLRQKDVASLLDVKQQTVDRWEKGTIPYKSKWEGIEKILGVRVSDYGKDGVIKDGYKPSVITSVEQSGNTFKQSGNVIDVGMVEGVAVKSDNDKKDDLLLSLIRQCMSPLEIDALVRRLEEKKQELSDNGG